MQKAVTYGNVNQPMAIGKFSIPIHVPQSFADVPSFELGTSSSFCGIDIPAIILPTAPPVSVLAESVFITKTSYIRTKHSKYSVLVMFTALKPSFNCHVCPDALKQFTLLASSYRAMGHSSHMFFVTVDYSNGVEAFKAMKLTHVPGFFYFPGSRNRKKSDKFDTKRGGYDAIPLARWLGEIDDIKIEVKEPFDYTVLIVPSCVTFLVLILFMWKPDLAWMVFGNKILWGIIVLFVVLIMTSGQMWNHIRKPPEASYHRKGGVQYIHGSRGSQFIFETYIIMAINAAITLGFILMSEIHSFQNRFVKRGMGFLGLCLVAVFFGLLISIFRMKNRSYPYSFLFE